MPLPAYSNLINYKGFLQRYPQRQQPAAFEYLSASSFGKIFNVPFQSKDNEDNTVKYRAFWNGCVSAMTQSPSGVDSICYAFGFYALIESTLRLGLNQWRKEFNESISHYDDFIANNQVKKEDVYLIMIAPKLHTATYECFKQKVKEEYNFIVLESTCVAKIGDTVKIVPTVRHLDLRQLFRRMTNVLKDSISFKKFKIELNKCITDWHNNILKRERTVFFGLRAYEAIKRIGKKTVGVSDILANLNKDKSFNYYMNKLGGDEISHIREGLLYQGLACWIETPYEDFFCRVDKIDFTARTKRLITAVEKIDV